MNVKQGVRKRFGGSRESSAVVRVVRVVVLVECVVQSASEETGRNPYAWCGSGRTGERAMTGMGTQGGDASAGTGIGERSLLSILFREEKSGVGSKPELRTESKAASLSLSFPAPRDVCVRIRDALESDAAMERMLKAGGGGRREERRKGAKERTGSDRQREEDGNAFVLKHQHTNCAAAAAVCELQDEQPLVSLIRFHPLLPCASVSWDVSPGRPVNLYRHIFRTIHSISPQSAILQAF